tara:strand:+ start:1833 stop:2627 length:795 start_codon:yes stop_codon:yes gene_type:complete
MKEYLVIGNPIEHSLSPKLHNQWIKENNIKAIYKKQKLTSNDLSELISKIKDTKISGVNVTVPFKNEIITHLDELTYEAKATQSVNTIYLDTNKVVGHNTDIVGFEKAIQQTNYKTEGKTILILGAGGVVPSIIFALYKMKALSITICNRTKSKAEQLKNLFNDLKIIEWGESTNFDMIINATSVGLNDNEELDFDFSKVGNNKFFYDVIYNPKETQFLEKAKKLGNKIENGKKMFIYQAAASFKIWHNVHPTINTKLSEFLDL